ncbi:MAG: nicotinate-nicotinamide nucleotide adenylyltransferase [Planctomycetota bacterium]
MLSRQPSPMPGVPPPTPFPAPAGDAQAILLFGGSFDPPHAAHTALAAAARDALAERLDSAVALLFIPAARSPHKPNPPASDHHRQAMLDLAVVGIPRAAIWTDELDRPPPSYFADTAARASVLAGDRPVYFLIGTDQAAAFHRWHEPRAILAAATPIVIPREPITTADQLIAKLRETHAWTDTELATWRNAWCDLPIMPHAATDARGLLRAGELVPADVLAPAVRDYIATHRPYAPRQ